MGLASWTTHLHGTRPCDYHKDRVAVMEARHEHSNNHYVERRCLECMGELVDQEQESVQHMKEVYEELKEKSGG